MTRHKFPHYSGYKHREHRSRGGRKSIPLVGQVKRFKKIKEDLKLKEFEKDERYYY